MNENSITLYYWAIHSLNFMAYILNKGSAEKNAGTKEVNLILH